MFERGQVYGAVLQLKDLLEVLIKFPVLLTTAQIYHKQGGRSASENKLLAALLQKSLSLGDWDRIANTLKKSSLAPSPLHRILEHICTIYNKYQITNWRNTEIGHGALAFAEDEKFQQDLKEKVELIAQHLSEYAICYQNISLLVREEENEWLLHGSDKGKDLDHRESEVLVRIKDEGDASHEWSLFP